MKIAVFSDSHGRTQTVARALKIIADRGITTRIHCGDLDDAAVAEMLPAGTHVVLGNCDTDRDEIEAALARAGCVSHGEWGYLELAGKKIAFTHGHLYAFRELQAADTFDFLFYGHTHVHAEHPAGKTRVINPGALHRASPKGFIIVDLASGEVEFVNMEPPS
jgi:putative phosphoesterase